MRYSTGFILGILSGALWGAIATGIAGISLTLITGLPATPVVAAGALAGAVNAAIVMVRPTALRSSALYLGAFVGGTLALLLAAFMMPFSLPLTVAPFIQSFAVALIGAALTFANKAVLHDLSSGALKRYTIEVLFVRVLKGLGFIFFTIIVVLPFYVMVMTSFKTQQELLLNPLDLSIDLAKGAEGLMVSYVKLFTEFNFGQFLLISTIVSVATVVITLAFSIPGAYAVARLRFPGQAFLSQSILLIYMVPAIVLVIPLYSVFSQLGLRNTLVGLLVVYPATTVPVALYMLQGYFRGLPAELEEAGADGRAQPGRGDLQDHPAAGPAGAGLGVALCLHDRLERVPVRLHVP